MLPVIERILGQKGRAVKELPSPSISMFNELGVPLDSLRLASFNLERAAGRALLLEDKSGGPPLLLHSPSDHSDLVNTMAELTFKVTADERFSGVQIHRVAPSVIEFVASKLKHSSRLEESQNDTESFNSFKELVQRVYSDGASDLRISTVDQNVKVLVRIDGDIRSYADDLTRDQGEKLLRAAFAKSEENTNSSSQLEFNQYMNTTVGVDVLEGSRHRKIYLRMQSNPQRGGHVNVSRLLAQRERTKANRKPLYETLADAGFMPDQAHEIALRCDQGSGGGLSVGETGSGKTNTSYNVCAALALPNKAGHSIEDPVEGTIYGMNQHTIQVKDGQTRGEAFEQAFTALLRSDPDFILIGEIRDAAGGQAFLDSSDAGHYTISTLHAESPVGAYRRLTSRLIGLPMDVITAPGFISWIAHHKLLQRLCPHCKIPVLSMQQFFKDPDFRFGVEELRLLSLLCEPERVYMRNEEGCDHCRDRTPGVKGRTLAAGVYLPDDISLQLIQGQQYAKVAQELRGRWLSKPESLKSALESDSAIDKGGMEVGLWKMIQGEIDPREIITAFQHFKPYLRQLGVKHD